MAKKPTQISNISETKGAFTNGAFIMKLEVSYIIFKGLSLKQINKFFWKVRALEPYFKSGPLKVQALHPPLQKKKILAPN